MTINKRSTIVTGISLAIAFSSFYVFSATSATFTDDLVNCLEHIQSIHNITEPLSKANIERVSLNDDSVDDALITLSTNDHCGTNGCIREICMSNDQGEYTHINVGYAAEAISISGAKTNDVADVTLTSRNNSRVLVWQNNQYILQ